MMVQVDSYKLGQHMFRLVQIDNEWLIIGQVQVSNKKRLYQYQLFSVGTSNRLVSIILYLDLI